jgi:DNA primase
MIETFGLGIATRGIMKHRLVFPIHNATGELVAYCGRYVGDVPPEDEPKYKQPPNVRKEWELFNWHRAKERLSATRPVVVVESFFSTIKLDVATDYPVVSPMGRSLSEDQLTLLKAGGVKRVMLLLMATTLVARPSRPSGDNCCREDWR